MLTGWECDSISLSLRSLFQFCLLVQRRRPYSSAPHGTGPDQTSLAGSIIITIIASPPSPLAQRTQGASQPASQPASSRAKMIYRISAPCSVTRIHTSVVIVSLSFLPSPFSLQSWARTATLEASTASHLLSSHTPLAEPMPLSFNQSFPTSTQQIPKHYILIYNYLIIQMYIHFVYHYTTH